MSRNLTIAIIGPGKVGTAIGILAAKAGMKVVAVAGRDRAKAHVAASAIGPNVKVMPAAAAAGAAGLVLLTTQDDAIAALCRELADAKAFAAGAVVAHCSGALASGILSPAAEACQCHVGSMHPLQTFPTVDAAVTAIAGACCFIEGDRPAAAVLMQLARAIGGKPVRIDPQGKVLYHAAAVMACNYLVTLLDAAAKLGELAGLHRGEFLRALGPLVRTTVDNVFTMGPEKALTGPVARGDVETYRRHLDALKDQTDLQMLYAMLGTQTAMLAMRKGTISAAEVMSFATATANMPDATSGATASGKKARRKRQ